MCGAEGQGGVLHLVGRDRRGEEERRRGGEDPLHLCSASRSTHPLPFLPRRDPHNWISDGAGVLDERGFGEINQAGVVQTSNSGHRLLLPTR